MILINETFKKFGYKIKALTKLSDRPVIVECPSCECQLTKSYRTAKKFLLCRRCYLLAIKKEHHCLECNKLISNKSTYCSKHFQSGNRNHNFKNGITSSMSCTDCYKQVSNYMAARCWSCYVKWSKIPKNNPRFGKTVPFFKITYKRIKFRSSWEANFAKWLDLSGVKWEYESKKFDLGDSTYTPDFYLSEFDCYIEIKGWFPEKTKRKLRKFAREYKKIKLIIYNKDVLKNIGIYQDARTLARAGIIYSK